MKSNKHTILFAVGIPIWSIMACVVDSINHASLFGGNWGDGAGTQTGNSIFYTKASCLIFGYFIFSSLVTIFSKDRNRRILCCIAAHLILLASVGSVLIPDFLSKSLSPGTAFMEAIFLIPAYLIGFAPWLMTWKKFALSKKMSHETKAGNLVIKREGSTKNF